MKLEIEVPEVTCTRCSAKGAMMPIALKRTAAAGSVTDSAGNNWQAQGATIPAGWTQAPNDEAKLLCPTCTESVTAGIAALLQPPAAPTALVKTAAASIPTVAEPVIGHVVRSSLTPAQKNAHVTSGATHYASQQSRPSHTVAAAPVIVQPSAISRPIAPAAPLHAPQPSAVLVGPPKIHAPITPAERGSNVVVASNTTFPKPKTHVTGPAPAPAETPRSRELPVMNNDEVEPQGPVTAVPNIRGLGV